MQFPPPPVCGFLTLEGGTTLVIFLWRNPQKITETHQWAASLLPETFRLCDLSKTQRSTCDFKQLILFNFFVFLLRQDDFKAVMLAHQYYRVSRIAWLCGFREKKQKTAMMLFNSFPVARGDALVCDGAPRLACGENSPGGLFHVTHHVAKNLFRAIYICTGGPKKNYIILDAIILKANKCSLMKLIS